MYKLQILVPHYKEPFTIVKPLLDSIALQQGVDLKEDVAVVMVNDGHEGAFDTSVFDPYIFDIGYYINSHEGVSAARNACLDLSSASYVMFCDCDDMFSSVFALRNILAEISACENAGQPLDALVSTFIQESYDPATGFYSYLNRGDKNTTGLDSIFVHGKVYRRAFLIENNIRWNPALTIHEDSYFNCLCMALSKLTKYIQQPFYLWKYRPDSVCRSDEDFILKTFPHLLKSSDALTAQFAARGLKDRACWNAYYTLFNTYYYFNTPSWQTPQAEPYRAAIVPYIYAFYKKYENDIATVEETAKIEIIRTLKNSFFARGLLVESITFDDWLTQIEQACTKK